MKISAVPSLGQTVAGVEGQTSQAPSIRSFKMNTNASPEQYLPPPAQELTISDDNRENTEPKPEVEATQPLSAQAAAFARQRRAPPSEGEGAQGKRGKAIEARSQGSDMVPLARLKSDPLNVLQEHGVTYDQLTEAILSNQNVNPEIYKLREEIKALKEGVEKLGLIRTRKLNNKCCRKFSVKLIRGCCGRLI